MSELGDGAQPTSARLAVALADAGAPGWMIDKAINGRYDDYLSPDPFPQLTLVRDLQDAARHSGVLTRGRLTGMVEQVKNGEFDGTAAEAAAWQASPEGQQAFQEILRGGPA